jgi:serine/threonine protein kinase
MTLCPECSHENSDDATNCSECMAELNPVHRDTVLDEENLDDYKPVIFEPDSLISGRYQIVKELGRGGMGVVYLVKDTRPVNERQVALKMILPNLVSHQEARQRFENEILVSLALHHPGSDIDHCQLP